MGFPFVISFGQSHRVADCGRSPGATSRTMARPMRRHIACLHWGRCHCPPAYGCVDCSGLPVTSDLLFPMFPKMVILGSASYCPFNEPLRLRGHISKHYPGHRQWMSIKAGPVAESLFFPVLFRSLHRLQPLASLSTQAPTFCLLTPMSSSTSTNSAPAGHGATLNLDCDVLMTDSFEQSVEMPTGFQGASKEERRRLLLHYSENPAPKNNNFDMGLMERTLDLLEAAKSIFSDEVRHFYPFLRAREHNLIIVKFSRLWPPLRSLM